MKKILAIVDVQNDFYDKKGSLCCPNDASLVEKLNGLMDSNAYDFIIATQDWHPAEHISFAKTPEQLYKIKKVSYGEQMQWPVHCVQNTWGAQFPNGLNAEKFNVILRKGFRKDVDSYSGVVENDKKTSVGLLGLLKDISPDYIDICGIATDVCVKNTVMDLKNSRLFKIRLLKDFCIPVSPQGEAGAIKEMAGAGVEIV